MLKTGVLEVKSVFRAYRRFNPVFTVQEEERAGGVHRLHQEREEGR